MKDKHVYHDDRERAAAEYLARVQDALALVAAVGGELDDALRTARSLSADFATITPDDANALMLAVDAAQRRADAMADAVELVGGCMRALDAMDGERARLLRMRHVEGMPWSAIARDMCYSERQCHRLHADALAEFAAYLPCE